MLPSHRAVCLSGLGGGGRIVINEARQVRIVEYGRSLISSSALKAPGSFKLEG
jgi:hypothetical protein